MVTVGLLVGMVAKPGRENEVVQFLEDALELVRDEPATTAWFGVRFSVLEFGIFEVSPHEAGRRAHLTGRVAERLKETGTCSRRRRRSRRPTCWRRSCRRLTSAHQALDSGHDQIPPGRNRFALNKDAGCAADAARERTLCHKAGPGKVSALLDLTGERVVGDPDGLSESDQLVVCQARTALGWLIFEQAWAYS